MTYCGSLRYRVVQADMESNGSRRRVQERVGKMAEEFSNLEPEIARAMKKLSEINAKGMTYGQAVKNARDAVESAQGELDELLSYEGIGSFAKLRSRSDGGKPRPKCGACGRNHIVGNCKGAAIDAAVPDTGP
jgi:predicted S18 family serine protease